jgi:methyltransferase-like protein
VASFYDVVAYPGHPFVQTHPDRLATIASLLGLQPPPIRNCRVLELACGDGGNLIPMALTMPEARFAGIDIASQPIAQGNPTIAALGLKNIELRQGDLLQVDRGWGEFDYIITHGLYAWSPEPVRDAILRISGQNLSRDGIAYVSYNALPGGRIRQMLREMMLFHAGEFEDPMELARQARALLLLVAEGRTRVDSFNALVREEVARMTDRDLWLLFHDELADVYEPVYLHQFVEHAERWGLQYLGDANLYNLQPATLTADAQETLVQIAGDDRVMREQYSDFIQCRRFHHTLLCRQGLDVRYPPAPQRIESLFVSTAATSVSPQPELAEGVEEEFKGPLDSGMKTGHPIAKALLVELIAESPQALSCDELFARIGGEASRAEVCQILLATSLGGLTDLHMDRRPLVGRVSARPVASPLARYQASQGWPLTTLTHCTVETTEQAKEELEMKLLPLLDGEHTHSMLRRKLRVGKRELEVALMKLARLGFLSK